MRLLYRKLLPYEWRYWIYKQRHPAQFRRLRTIVHPSPKGDFSLRACDRLECIFVHITKSAGTSVALSLFGELPYHYTAAQYRVIFGRKTFNRYFKFTFVRNPWDRLYSAYSYLKGGGWNDYDKRWAEDNLSHIADFNEFVTCWLTPERLNSHVHFWPQLRFICDYKGRVIIDHLAYFENIEEEFGVICDKLGIEAGLEHTNTSSRKNYKDVYTPESIARVAQLYEKDIHALGYSFDSYTPVKFASGQKLI